MDFTVFNTNTTNIFPMANDTKNGQLMTEWNLRSRETVGTSEAVKYMIGPSYTHAEEDFNVDVLRDSTGVQLSSSIIQIATGRALVNGHFIESLAPIQIDLLEANANARTNGLGELKGRLAIGLRAMYSTETTMAGALLPYNSDAVYEGIKVVILPIEEFKLPQDVPTMEDQVTAHLKLAEFTYNNSSISSIIQNYPARIQNVSADRIGDVDRLLSDTYITKNGLNPGKLYTMAGKGTEDGQRLDTWCDSTGSLMVWDANPTLEDGASSTLKEAAFTTTSDGHTILQIPHQNVDGMTNTAGEYQHYSDKVYQLPLASYSAGTAGTVDRAYTNHVKAVQEEINNIYRMPNGKQVGFIDVLDFVDTDVRDLPEINNNWNIGDYIVVRQDNTLTTSYEGVQPPATIYVLLPGIVSAYTFHSVVTDDTTVPEDITGIEIERDTWTNADGSLVIDTTDPEVYGTYFDLSPNYRGSVGTDYFLLIEIYTEILNEGQEDEETVEHRRYYYYTVSQSGDRSYSEPVQITAEIPLAQEDIIGGFYNVPETQLDAGYVFRDETGHLVLLDYALLRSGVLAYQLGEDFESPANITFEEVQTNLDEYVNERVAFPNANQQQNADNPNVINITLNLSEEAEEDSPIINIYNIDSRFNTSIYIHINGSANSATVINISDCQKVRIDSNINGNSGTRPTINLYRSCLYYDPNVIDMLNTIQDMSLWYEKYEETDADLLVDNMTVREVNSPVLPDDLDYWNYTAPNDNHYMYALQSITFGPDGSIVGAGMYVKNETTSNVATGKSIITSTFSLPQGYGLNYPKSKLTKQIKITGSFVSAYANTSPEGYMVMNTSFSALTNATDPNNSDTNVAEGSISFLTDAELIQSVAGLPLGTTLDCWQTGSFNVFHGVVI